MIRIIQIVAAVALTLTLAACGGSDDSALHDQIAMLEMERDEANTAKMTTEGQIADLQAEVAQLESEIAMLVGRADISPEDLAGLRSEVETLQGEVARLMGRADISPEDLAMLEMERDEANTAKMTAEGQIADLQAEVAQLESQIAMLVGRADISPEDLAGLRSEVETLQGEVVRLMGRADISPEDLAMLEMERDEATTAKMTTEGQIADLQAEVARTESEIAMLEGRADISPEDLAGLRSEVETLQGEVARLMGGTDISPEDLARLRSEVEALQAEVAHLESEIAMLVGRADISPEDLAMLEAEVEQLKGERIVEEMERQARRDAQADAGLGNGLARTIAAPFHASSNTDTLANLVTRGQAVFAPLSASVRRAVISYFPGNGAAYLKAISGDGQGGLNVTWTIDGVETPVHFAAGTREYTGEDRSYLYWRPDEPDYSYDYLDLMWWNVSFIPSVTAATGFSTFGAQTMPENLPVGSATYVGNMEAERWALGLFRDELQGALTLEADLSDMVLSGQIDDIIFRNSGEPLEGSSIVIQRTGISDAEFMAPWVASGPAADAERNIEDILTTLHGFEGTVVGEFYGPAAEEVGGVLSGMRTDEKFDEFLIGGFVAAQ